MLYTSNTIFWILNMFTSSCWREGCGFSVGFIPKSYLWLRWAVPNGSFWKSAHFHPEVCVINTQCFEPRYQLWICIMYNFIYYSHKNYVMFVQILHHISCIDNISCYRILLNVQTSTYMLSDQSKLDTHTIVPHNRCQQLLESYLLVKGINLIKELLVTVPAVTGIFF
jgi:hypothetical protein